MKIFTKLLFLLLITATCFSAEWKQILPSKTKAYSMTQNSTRVFISTYDQGLFIADNGSTFLESRNNGLNGFAATRISAFATNIFYISEGGLFFSENNGDSWKLIYDSYVNDVLFLNGTIFIATPALKFSTDNGATWQDHDNESLQINSFTYFSNKIYAACSNNSIYTSSDNGSNWTKSSLKPLKNISRMVCNDNKIVGLYMDGTTFYSNGQNSITTSSVDRSLDVFVVNNDFYSIGATGLYRMTSNSQNFSPIKPSNMYPGYSAAVVNSTVYYGTSDDDTWYYKLDNATSYKCGNGLLDQNIFTINSDSKSNLYVGSADGIFKSPDKAITFAPITPNLPANLTNCNIIKTYNDNIIAGFLGQAVFVSTNQGQNWQMIPTLSQPTFTEDIIDIAYTPTSILVATSNAIKKYNLNGIYVGEFGESFSGSSVNAIATKNEDVYIATNFGIKAFVDGAWLSAPGLICKALLITDDGTVYGAGYDKRFYVKKPSQMFELTQATNKINIESLEMVNNVLVAATATGVYYFHTNSNTWLEMNSGLFSTRLKVIHKFSNTLFTGGNGFAFIDISSGINDVQIYNSSNNKLSINPNPATNYINIDLNENINDFADIKIIDINGITQFEANNIEISNGKLLSNLKLDNLSSGSYFVVIRTLTKVYTSNIIVNR